MQGTLVKTGQAKYIDMIDSGFSIHNESHLNDLLSLCYFHDCNHILVDQANLSDDFFNLRTGLAGAALQKFSNYKVRVAVVLPLGANHNERFRELMYEMNQSQHFRFYTHRDDAAQWLLRG